MMETKSVHSYRFIYKGASRIVDNVTFEKDTLVGFEMRKSGKFSFQTKRYSLDQINTLERIAPPDRKGRPTNETSSNTNS